MADSHHVGSARCVNVAMKKPRVYLDEEGKGGEKVTSATMDPAPMASAQRDAVRV